MNYIKHCHITVVFAGPLAQQLSQFNLTHSKYVECFGCVVLSLFCCVGDMVSFPIMGTYTLITTFRPP